jgi:Kef-type K+ transport system membrane component KefB
MLLAEVREELRLEEPIQAVEGFLAPIFFAMVGVRLELAALANASILLYGSVVLIIALLGKLLGGFLGALSQGFRRAMVVGIGMSPRGEVGLIVAALGLAAGAVNEEEYALVLFMVIGTTLLAPLFLRPSITWAERVPEPRASREPLDETQG